MGLYVATEAVLRRARELGQSVVGAAEDAALTDDEVVIHAAQVLEEFLDVELVVWSDPSMPEGDAVAAAADLAATWVALGAVRFDLRSKDLEGLVLAGWPDKIDAWREHGREVAAVMGATSGDWPVAISFLDHVTEELLGRPLQT